MKFFNAIFATLAVSMAFVSIQAHSETMEKQKVVFQVSDADSAKWNLALNNVKNVQQMVGGADKVDAEIVVYGPGISMLKSDSIVGNRVEDAKKAGVHIVACQNTMKGMKLTDADMLPHTDYVPAGVIELMKKQKEGFAYIRP